MAEERCWGECGGKRPTESPQGLCRQCLTKLGLPGGPKANQVEVMNLIGDVEGKNVLIRDDMVDTGGSLCSAADFVKERGALDIFAAATHGVLSGKAIEIIDQSPIKQMIITDSINQGARSLPDKFKILECSELIAKAISRIFDEQSVSSLFSETPEQPTRI